MVELKERRATLDLLVLLDQLESKERKETEAFQDHMGQQDRKESLVFLVSLVLSVQVDLLAPLVLLVLRELKDPRDKLDPRDRREYKVPLELRAHQERPSSHYLSRCPRRTNVPLMPVSSWQKIQLQNIQMAWRKSMDLLML